MTAAQLSALDRALHFHPQTEPASLEAQGPFIMHEGDGVWVTDIDGNRYIEGMSSLWCASLGFSEQRLADAAYRQMRALGTYHTFNGRSNQPCIELSEELLKLTPFAGNGRVSYVNSGSEAVDSMIKATWMYQAARGNPKKRKIISRDRAYHGSTVLGASLSGLPLNRGPFVGTQAEVLFTKAPHYHGREHSDQSEAEFVDYLASDLERLIEREGADSIAAMIMEPIMGAGGVIIPPNGYFERITKILRANEILILSDEVITGFGRTGSWFGCQSFEFVPDMMSVAKALSSGYQPIGAVLFSENVYRHIADEAARIGTYGHGFTYAGHPVTSAVALETLRLYHERDILQNVRCLAGEFARQVGALAQHELVGDARSRGLIGAVELKRTDPGVPLGPVAVEQARANGLVLRSLGDVVAICPPLISTAADVEEIFKRLRVALGGIGSKRG